MSDHDHTGPGCSLCGDNDGPLMLRSRCHLTAPLSVSLEGDVLILRCYLPDCRREIARFRVSGGPIAPVSR